MRDTSKRFCSVLFDILLEKGVRDVVCSPGSRNVPLLLAAAARDELRKHFVVDERSAAFLGLGISLVNQSPVALVCTSGTALLNYSPAVAEAYYQAIPLIVISADRPLQWIDQEDSQTLRQDSALDNYVKKSYSIPAFGNDDPELTWYVNRIANDAVSMALSGRPGPVHINIHLNEPLGLKRNRCATGERIINTLEGDTIANKEILKDLAKKISSSKVLLVAGYLKPNSALQKCVSTFSRFPNVAVMAETISNLHLSEEDYCVDTVLTAFPQEDLDSLSPDIVISIGGALVSRKLKEFLRRNQKKCTHWSVGYSHIIADPFMALSLRIEIDPARFFRNINSLVRRFNISETAINFSSVWNKTRNKASEIKNNYIQNCGWSELQAFDIILKSLPSSYNLFLSNGTPIRYAQIIRYSLPHASYCNRGVSGIDGCLSTAIGGAMAYRGNTLLITGDLSLSYDLSALGLKNIPHSFKIIIIDNQGGGIFRFIPTTSGLEECEEYLCQSPILPLKQLAEGFEWEYFECDNLSSLHEILPVFFASQGKTILKIKCDGIESASILRNYMNIKTK